MKRSLSLCMIVRDERENLPRCLASMVCYCDEIIVVDTGSIDDTRQIARQFGAQVFEFAWNDNFSEARNKSLQYAHGDWIIYLDGDEHVLPENGLKLCQLLNDEEAMAFDLIIRSRLSNDYHTGEYPRLFRNHPQIKFEGRIHEQIVPSIQRLGGRIKKSDVVIDHLGYDQEPSVLQKKYRRNEKLLLQQIQDCPADAFAHYCLGNLYDMMGEIHCAKEYYWKSVMINSEQPKAWFLLGNKFLHIGDYQQAEQCYRKAYSLSPEVSEIIHNLAVSQIKQANYENAAQSFQLLLKLRPNDEQIKRKITACLAKIDMQHQILYENHGA